MMSTNNDILVKIFILIIFNYVFGVNMPNAGYNYKISCLAVV